MKYEMPALTQQEREDVIAFADFCKGDKGNPSSLHFVCQITLAALTADTSKLAELAAKVRKVRGDAADFDGDRRGMWEYQEEQEQLLLEEAVKYTAPPVPALKPIDLSDGFLPSRDTGSGGMRPATGGYWLSKVDVIKAIRAAGYEVKDD